jgi:2-dehydro-3-deoxyphosphogluconate aldolase / (4S)-4-hydroxy-2-oxoglutarate aldolase
MARFKRLETLNAMQKIGIIPVFYEGNIEVSKKIVGACAEGGAICVEMTNRGDHAIDIFSELEKYCRQKLPQIILGTGSIIDAPTAALYIAHGSNFIVGPTIDEDTAILCNKRKIPYSPGCGSATEIQKAHSLGVEYCKLFPGAQVGGAEFVKAILGPCPWTAVMPTGGVSPTKESLTEWFSAGVSCVGMGSKLIKTQNIKNNDYEKIKNDVKKVITIIEEIRKDL